MPTPQFDLSKKLGSKREAAAAEYQTILKKTGINTDKIRKAIDKL